MDLIDFRRAVEMMVGCINFDILSPSRPIPVILVHEGPTRVRRILRKPYIGRTGCIYFRFVRPTGASCRPLLCRRKSRREHKCRDDDKYRCIVLFLPFFFFFFFNFYENKIPRCKSRQRNEHKISILFILNKWDVRFVYEILNAPCVNSERN